MHKRLNVILLVLVLLAGSVAPVVAQRSWLEFDNNLRVFGRTVIDGTTRLVGDLTAVDSVSVGDDLTVADTATVTGQMNANGALVTAADLGNTAETTVTVTSGGTITPLGRWVPLSSAGNVGTSSVAGCAAGDAYSEDIVMINMANTTITLTDTGTLKLSGNIALGQNDVLILKCDNLHGNWIQVGTTNN